MKLVCGWWIYKRMQWHDRAHFFAVSAQLMRRILVEHARRHNLKRGGGVPHVPLDEAVVMSGDGAEDIVALDDAMNALARFDSRKVQVVEMRYFGGLSVEETAEVLKVSPVTVMRDWSAAKAWLHRELTRGTSAGKDLIPILFTAKESDTRSFSRLSFYAEHTRLKPSVPHLRIPQDVSRAAPHWSLM
jgi:hypothetical protein